MRAVYSVPLRALLWALGGLAVTLIGGLLAPAAAGAGCDLPLICPPEDGGDGEDPRISPDPGGDEAGAVPVPPPPGKYFGVHQPLWESGPYRLGAERTAQIAARAGANALRFELPWLAVEPAFDVWDRRNWARYRRMYDALVSRGMTPVITIGFAPAWARDP